jgi:hypothetical protein
VWMILCATHDYPLQPSPSSAVTNSEMSDSK